VRVQNNTGQACWRAGLVLQNTSAKYEQAGGGWEDSDRNDWCERRDSNTHGFTRQILSSQ